MTDDDTYKKNRNLPLVLWNNIYKYPSYKTMILLLIISYILLKYFSALMLFDKVMRKKKGSNIIYIFG